MKTVPYPHKVEIRNLGTLGSCSEFSVTLMMDGLEGHKWENLNTRRTTKLEGCEQGFWILGTFCLRPTEYPEYNLGNTRTSRINNIYGFTCE